VVEDYLSIFFVKLSSNPLNNYKYVLVKQLATTDIGKDGSQAHHDGKVRDYFAGILGKRDS